MVSKFGGAGVLLGAAAAAAAAHPVVAVVAIVAIVVAIGVYRQVWRIVVAVVALCILSVVICLGATVVNRSGIIGVNIIIVVAAVLLVVVGPIWRWWLSEVLVLEVLRGAAAIAAARGITLVGVVGLG